MGATVAGYRVRSITPHGHAEHGRIVINVNQALPQSNPADLFTITGTILVTGLFGVVTTAIQAQNVSPSFGIGSDNTAIAAVPAVPWNGNVVGSVVHMPPSMGAALPTLKTIDTAATTAMAQFVVHDTIITWTTAANDTGNITFVMSYIPLSPPKSTLVLAANN